LGGDRQLAFDVPAQPSWSTQRILIVGWNTIVRRAVEHLRGFLGVGSTVTVLVDASAMSADEGGSLEPCEAVDRVETARSSAELLAAIVTELDREPDAVAIVPYRDMLSPSQADAGTLVAMSAARAAIGTRSTRIVSELRETRAAALTTLMRPDDLVLSDAVTASTIAQLADRPWLDGVLADLLDWHGSAFFIYDPRAGAPRRRCDDVLVPRRAQSDARTGRARDRVADRSGDRPQPSRRRADPHGRGHRRGRRRCGRRLEHGGRAVADGRRAVMAPAIGAGARRAVGWLLRDPSRLMIASAVVALSTATFAPGLDAPRIWSTGLELSIAGHDIRVDAGGVIVRGLMTAFFLCVGLEIRREIAIGTLHSVRAALAPVLCAVGGMIVPMLVYVSLAGGGQAAAGWAVPSATDVALAVGLAGLIAPGLSAGARAFLLTLAVADDIGGVAIIGLWYSHGVALLPAAGAVALAAVAALAVRSGIMRLTPALLLVVPAWALTWNAHVEPPIIGALFGLLTPIGRGERGREVAAEAERCLDWLGPLVGVIVLPLFAAVAASAALTTDSIDHGVVLGVALGLCVGKPVGIFGALWLLRRARIAELPAGATARELLGVSILAGIGFTVSLYIAGAGLPTAALQHSATLGVFTGSLLAAVAGAVYFRGATRPNRVEPATAGKRRRSREWDGGGELGEGTPFDETRRRAVELHPDHRGELELAGTALAT
jgi:Na+:H+ antiporter, NhaA family